MTPVVIDTKKKRQYTWVFVISVIASFVLGFGSGYFINQRQELQSYDELKSRIQNESEIIHEQQDAREPPAKESETGDSETGKEKPEKKTSNRDVQVNSSEKTPEPSTQQNTVENRPPPVKAGPPPPNKSATHATVNKVAMVTSKIQSDPTLKTPQKKPAGTSRPEAEPIKHIQSSVKPPPPSETEPDSIETRVRQIRPSSGVPAPNRPEPRSMVPLASTDENTKMFAVQVGLFASRENAQKLVYELIDNGYDAYMDEFVSSDGQLKYNVRFGRYADRASVQSKLAEYKQHYATSAYIIIAK